MDSNTDSAVRADHAADKLSLACAECMQDELKLIGMEKAQKAQLSAKDSIPARPDLPPLPPPWKPDPICGPFDPFCRKDPVPMPWDPEPKPLPKPKPRPRK